MSNHEMLQDSEDEVVLTESESMYTKCDILRFHSLSLIHNIVSTQQDAQDSEMSFVGHDVGEIVSGKVLLSSLSCKEKVEYILCQVKNFHCVPKR